ncbi:MAG: ATP-binding protein [Epsilonproteobacteria bacterium]|nr:ATP-binding protein [Campylobacterota bacterium]
MQKLPIGIQTFSQIREENYIYIDKTHLAFDLIENYKYAFLSRPRRFGKSLFLDTLHNIFEGNRELFEGLAVYDKWNWEERYPVIKISWGGSDYVSLEETKHKAFRVLKENQKRLGIVCEDDFSPAGCLEELIQKAYDKYQKRVVVLVDEYDKPILNNIDNTKLALQNRNFLRGFYEVLKDNDAYIQFAFLTGISKFSKANIFSGLNNIEDISLTPKYATICGYTQKDIENDFKEHLEGADLEKVKEWYNGYNFLGENVYNPFDILQFIDNNFFFKNYWWESGNPSFLITLLKQKPYNIPELENITVGDELLNSFEIENLRLEVLLFQSGYLTIEKFYNDPEFGINEYKLRVPNKEVNISLNRLFLDYLTNGIRVERSIIKALFEADLEKFKEIFISLFASIPYNNYVKNNIGEYEGYYASVFYAYLAASGLKIIAEDVTNSSRIDLTILIQDKVYIIEFKVDSDNALQQIKEKNYAKKYKNEAKEIYLVGICFDSEEKNIKSFEWEKL